MPANDKQVGGKHYKRDGIMEHWDFTWENGYDQFQYIITKWVHRWRDKGGITDLRKARHALDKYIELEEARLCEVEDEALQEQMHNYTKQG